jgi:hypothetical protein
MKKVSTKKIYLTFAVILFVCVFTMGQASNMQPFEIALSGRLISGLDAAKIVTQSGGNPEYSNFATLTNFEYTDNGIRSVRGMSVINSSAMNDNPKIRNIFQLRKSQPPESHVLVQAYNSGETQSKVFRLSTNPPNTGTFTPVALHTDASVAGRGRFSDAPLGHVVYCNGEETLTWSGIESRPSYFAIYDGLDDPLWIKDYTEQIWTTRADSENIATLKRSASTGSVTCYIVNTLPIEAFKLYIESANTRAAATVLVDYWTGSSYTPVTSLSDSTYSGGIPLAQTGTISFDSTEDTAKVKIFEGIMGYFYRLTIPDATDTCTISRITITEPFQKLRDIWDGNPRRILSFQVGTGTIFTDGTTNVFEDQFIYDDSTGFDESSYVNLDNKGGLGSHFVLGFQERQMGVYMKFIPGKENTLANATLAVYYWNGETWQAVTDLVDSTFTDSKTFRQSGQVTWAPQDRNVEFKTTVSTQTVAIADPLYYYKFETSIAVQGASDRVLVYYIAGIPAQVDISNYKFALNAQERLWLFNDQAGDKNSALVSNQNTLNVFNGDDSRSGDRFFFGNDDDVLAATELHIKSTEGSLSNILVLKNNSTYLIDGFNPDTWRIIQVSDRIGCNAPLTLDNSSIGLEFSPLQGKQVAVWQGNGGIYAWDGTSILSLSDSVKNYFDQTRTESIKLSRASESRGFFEVNDGNHYYHWLFTSNATTTNHFDSEVIFDFRHQGWFEMDRAGRPLQAGTVVIATDTGVTYSYGAIDTGQICRLHNGNDFAGGNITATFSTGEIPLSGSVMQETKLRYLRLITGSKATTTNNIQITHYVDGNNTGQTFTMSPTKSGYRLTMPVASRDQYGTFHRIMMSMTTNNEVRGFEPLYIGGWFTPWRNIFQ